MTERIEYTELLRRLLDGEDPLALEARSDAESLAQAMRSLEILSLTADPVKPSASLRDAIVCDVEDGRKLTAFTKRAASFFDIDENRARALLASVAEVDSAPWVDDVVLGARVRPVDGRRDLGEGTAMLVYLEPGTVYPTHRHLGDEWCLFLQGRGVEAGREWNPGDLTVNAAGSQHPVLEAVGSEPFVLGIVLYEGIEFAEPSPRA